RRRACVARGDLLHTADLLRLLRLLGHGHRPRPDVWFSLPRKFPVAVHRGYGAGILATLAYVAVVVVSRLPLRAAWGQSRLAAQDVSEPRDRVFPVRPLARRELELRDLGSLSRNVPGTRAPRPGCGSAAALVAVSSRLSAARRDDRMGVLPGRYAADRD